MEVIEAVDYEFERLLDRLDYFTKEKKEKLKTVYKFAVNAHEGQKRKSGEPYISHPVKVAALLSEYSPDYTTVAAALLHDVIEDSNTDHNMLSKEFGEEIAFIVEGVSKLKLQKDVHYKEKQAENFQKMALAMARDLRVIFVKLADRLHNMRTIHYMSLEKAKRIAKETMHVYAPLAHRLGIDNFYRELEDLAFKTIYPLRYSMIEKAVIRRRDENKNTIEKTIEVLEKALQESNIQAKVQGRQKHYASIYHKMASGLNDITDSYYQEYHHGKRRSSFNDIMDIHGFRIIVEEVDQCYLALGSVHQRFSPLPGRFKDYIAVPKSNGYQSLHTTVLGPMHYPIEVQIRTRLMHDKSLMGVAAHWNYKKAKQDNSANEQVDRWLAEIPLWVHSAKSEEFFRFMRADITSTEVYVYSKDGDIYALPRNSTPVDFAYAIHTQIGNTCIGCTIDGKESSLSTRLQNGQRITIHRSPDAKPNIAWRDFVVTGKALHALGAYLRNQKVNESIELGRYLLSQAMTERKRNLNSFSNEEIDDYLDRSQQPNFEYVLERIGLGKSLANNVANELLQSSQTSQTQQRNIIKISAENVSMLTFGKCCHPVYGDKVVALIRSDSGIVIHRRSCANIRKLLRDPHRKAYVQWDEGSDVPLPVSIHLEVRNIPQLIGAIASTIGSLDGNILSLDANEKDVNIQVLIFEVLVKNRLHLSRILRKLRLLADIHHVARAR